MNDQDRDPDGGPQENSEFAERALESMKEVFWDPEIERRGGIEVTGPIYKALAILLPGHPVEVRFNDEVQLVARARVNAAVKRGDPVTVDNVDAIEAIEPLDVDLNAGWAAYIVLPDGRHFAQFDFIRNRGRSLRLLALARDYLGSARSCLKSLLLGPAVEDLMAAAELAVTAQTYCFETDVPEAGGRRNAHSARLHWTKVNVGLGNTTPEAHETLVSLQRLRGAARYGEGDVPSPDLVTDLLASVDALVEDAAKRIGQPLRTQDPAFISDVLGHSD